MAKPCCSMQPVTPNGMFSLTTWTNRECARRAGMRRGWGTLTTNQFPRSRRFEPVASRGQGGGSIPKNFHHHSLSKWPACKGGNRKREPGRAWHKRAIKFYETNRHHNRRRVSGSHPAIVRRGKAATGGQPCILRDALSAHRVEARWANHPG